MFIDAPEESTVTGDVADWYKQQRDAWGYLPNYTPAFATRPDVAQAWTTLNNAIRGHMERRRYEIVTIAAARTYHSTYCMAAHCKFLRDNCDDEATMRSIAADPSSANLARTDQA
jgi:alkylhydroperoxidase family enzyme